MVLTCKVSLLGIIGGDNLLQCVSLLGQERHSALKTGDGARCFRFCCFQPCLCCCCLPGSDLCCLQLAWKETT